MARKPSERRSFKHENMELNLTPMMNLIAILIPVLLVSTAFIELAVINVSAAIGPEPDDKSIVEPKPRELNLTVTLTQDGYSVTGSSPLLETPQPSASQILGPTIPIRQQSVSCRQYLNTWPPPRSKNKTQPKCADDASTRTFWVYDKIALQKRLVEIKDAFPSARRMIIAAEASVEFEAITDVMDVGRGLKDPGGETRALFDEVMLSPG